MKNRLLPFILLSAPYIAIAADLSGTWKSEFDSQIGRQKYTYTLKQEGDKLSGKANSEINDQKRETSLSDGKVDGDKVSFVECSTSMAITSASLTVARSPATK